MIEFRRLLCYVRPYAAPLIFSVVLMLCVGVTHMLMAVFSQPPRVPRII